MAPKASAKPKLPVCYGLVVWSCWRSQDSQGGVDISEQEMEGEMGASGNVSHLLADTSTDVCCCLSQAKPCVRHWGPKGLAMKIGRKQWEKRARIQ